MIQFLKTETWEVYREKLIQRIVKFTKKKKVLKHRNFIGIKTSRYSPPGVILFKIGLSLLPYSILDFEQRVLTFW